MMAMVLFSAVFTKAQTTDNSSLIAQLQAQIAQLLAQIQTLSKAQPSVQQTPSPAASPVAWCHTFNADLGYQNSGNSEVAHLHTALRKEGISYGQDSNNSYSKGTSDAILVFQAKYGISPTGYTGPATRVKLNALYGCASAQTQTQAQTSTIPTCTDTSAWDPENAGYVVGIDVNGQPYRQDDECKSSTQLLEKECTYESGGRGFPRIAWYTCPGGCENGACKPVVQKKVNFVLPYNNKIGQTINIVWTSSGFPLDARVNLNLLYYQRGTSKYLTYPIANGILLSQGTYPWTVSDPAGLLSMTTNRGFYVIEIMYNNSASYTSPFLSILPAGGPTCSDNEGATDLYVKGTVSGIDINGQSFTRSDECVDSSTLNETQCAYDQAVGGFVLHTGNLSCGTSTCVDGACIKPTIKLLSPNGNENWEIGKTYTITWEATNFGYVYLTLYNAEQQDNCHLNDNRAILAPQNSFTFTLNSTCKDYLDNGSEKIINVAPGSKYKVLASAWPGAQTRISAESDNYFTVSPAGGGIALKCADMDGNGIISPTDVIFVFNRVGQCTGGQKFDAKADLDGDGCITASDVVAVQRQLGVKVNCQVAAIPAEQNQFLAAISASLSAIGQALMGLMGQ